jgi:hypothetical protein
VADLDDDKAGQRASGRHRFTNQSGEGVQRFIVLRALCVSVVKLRLACFKLRGEEQSLWGGAT